MLVHCHAGQGRTGVIIAAYLMYKNISKSVDDTIDYIRSQRTECLRKEYNRAYLNEIQNEFNKFRQVFPKKGEHFRYKLEDIISNQLKFFHGPERVKYKYIPKVMDLCLVKLYQLLESGKYDQDEIIDSFLLIEEKKSSFEDEELLDRVKDDLNQGKWDAIISVSNKPNLLAQLFLDFCESLAAPVISMN